MSVTKCLQSWEFCRVSNREGEMARERHNACSNSGQWKGGDEKKNNKKQNVLHIGFRAVEVQASYKITINICDWLSINWAYAANVAKLRLIHHQRANLLLSRMVLLFFQSDCEQWSKLISAACGTYNARKFWNRRTSGSVRRWTIAWKYAYKNLALHSGSPTHSVVLCIRSSTCDRSSRIDYWTLNSRNVNSMFAA